MIGFLNISDNDVFVDIAFSGQVLKTFSKVRLSSKVLFIPLIVKHGRLEYCS